MANLQKVIVVGINVEGDGVNNTFTLDLLKDPYHVFDALSGQRGDVINWFSSDLRVSQPTAAAAPGSPDSVSLSGTIVTYTFSTAPATGQVSVEFQLRF